MPRPEQPFASFEQTLPGPMMMTALWPLADVPKRMTLVHGRSCSRCSSLGAKRQLRSEASYSRSPSILLYKMRPNRAARRWRTSPIKRAFLARFQCAANKNMRFKIEVIDLPRLYDESPAFDIQPIHSSKKSEWLVLKGSGELVIVDFGDRSIRSVGRVD